ncbi:hypothetical protein FB451DRAFT_1214834 [Mycena latifolia]|nr:hypothetical protein FB451DRAFT_1214834 [Mycena latifolia]
MRIHAAEGLGSRKRAGRLGDPHNDFRVPDGAFSSSSSFHLWYPSPHTIRRNFTRQPYINFPLPGFIPNPSWMPMQHSRRRRSTNSSMHLSGIIRGFGGISKPSTYVD